MAPFAFCEYLRDATVGDSASRKAKCSRF